MPNDHNVPVDATQVDRRSARTQRDATSTFLRVSRTALGIVAIVVLGMTFAPPAIPQERERPSDLATDNLELVSASAVQIREVLAKDPGLMVELKRLMAKRATEQGQIVSAADLEESAILERLEKDLPFRAQATRLLQRYGYLTPQLNPQSSAGQEQALLLKARADELARAETESRPPVRSSLSSYSYSSTAPCGPGEDAQSCAARNSKTSRRSQVAMESPETSCEPGEENASCQGQTSEPSVTPGRAPAERSAPESGQPSQESPDLTAQELLTTTSANASGSARVLPVSASPRTGTMPDGMASENELYALTRPVAPGAEDVTGGAGLMPPALPEPPETQAPRTLASRGEMKPPMIPEPVEIVKSPSPYAYVPSLYDLYVQAAPRTGKLDRFGLDVFRRPLKSTGIPMDLPAGPEYVLGPGDGLTIDLWGGVAQRLYRTVDREGRVALPEAGPIMVSGKTLGEVQEVAQRVLRTQYRDVSADISLGRLRTVRVYVVGEVVSPGAYDVSSLSTPLNALWAAGGVTTRGSLRLLRHSRGQELVEQVDVYDLLLKGVRGNLHNLENGDTLLVPPVGPQVTVDGMVRRPAIYELRGETNLSQVLDLAGGVLPAAALRHIEVQRLDAHQKRTMYSLNLDDTSDAQAVHRQMAAFSIQDGDEVHIFPIAPYNSTEVYLQGHVLRPGRYAFTPGMRVTDLLASYQDCLPEPANHYAEIIRLSQPDWRPVVESFDLDAALAKPAASPQLAPLDTVRIFGKYDVEPPPVVWLSGEVRTPGQYRTTGQMHLRDAIYQAGGLRPDAALDSAQLFRTQPDGTLRILDVNLAAALNADPLENVLVQPRDRIIVHRNLIRVDPPSVYVKGEVANPGRYPLAANMRLGDLLDAAGGPKRSADLKNADLTRYHSVSGADPAAEHESVDLTPIFQGTERGVPLKDGDVLSVPQLPGWNDLGSSVTVKGEVKNPGVYGIRPGEHLSSVLKRAGGLLPTAYPQGVVFTRVSVRDLQEKSRQDLIQRLEQETPTAKTAITTTGAEAAALQAEALQQRQRALEALRRAPVSGRLVILMQPGLKGFEHSAQDIELRNGDSVEIPKQPGFVLVIGQVFNTNAITYTPGKNAGWYLSQGGGPTRLADKKNIFIVRANGEVVSHSGGGWWSGDVLSVALRPGDAVVVPEKVVTGSSTWKNVIAIAQLAEAAAITVAVAVP